MQLSHGIHEWHASISNGPQLNNVDHDTSIQQGTRASDRCQLPCTGSYKLYITHELHKVNVRPMLTLANKNVHSSFFYLTLDTDVYTVPDHCTVIPFIEPVAAPENVQVEASEDKPSIFVTWSPIQKQYYNSDSLTGYHVRYTTSSKDCRGEEIEVGPDETSCSLDFLDRGVAYAVSVAAANDVGMGPYSSPSVAIVGGAYVGIEELLVYITVVLVDRH